MIYPCPVVNFHISGTKWASPGTRDTVGQFRDDPGHSGTVGKPSYKVVLHKTTPELQDQDQDRFFLVSDRSCPKTDGLRPHHWKWPLKCRQRERERERERERSERVSDITKVAVVCRWRGYISVYFPGVNFFRTLYITLHYRFLRWPVHQSPNIIMPASNRRRY